MEKQVFQTHSVTRWRSFVWLISISAIVVLLGIASVIISIAHKRYYEINLFSYKSGRLPELNFDKGLKAVSGEEQRKFANHIRRTLPAGKRLFYNTPVVLPQAVKKYLPVKAAFYVNWDRQSWYSLRQNSKDLNMVLPEWIFQTGSRGNLDFQPDTMVINLLRTGNIDVLPVFTNNLNGKWEGDTTYLMLSRRETRTWVIRQIKSFLDKYKFQGINIDLESLPGKAYPYLVDFSRELYIELHPSGYLITFDADPFDENLSFAALSGYYDFIFLMSYDEHYPESPPGPVSSINFVKGSLNTVIKFIPARKIVLCVAGYGYNWPEGRLGEDITYHQFISLASEYGCNVKYDSVNSDLSIKYPGDSSRIHEAHCNDAAVIFNIMRIAADYGTAGTALWYVGSEDARVSIFYNRQLSFDSLERHHFDFSRLDTIHKIYSIDYEGNGEILEIKNRPKAGVVKIDFDSTSRIITGEKYISLPSSYLVRRYGSTGNKVVALTFDDGPDQKYTPAILDVLRKKNVAATFFVTGINVQDNIGLLKREYREGHEIGNHTFTHPDLEKISPERERIELRSTRLLLESILGHSTILFRTPYNTDAEPSNNYEVGPLDVAKDEGFINVASSIDPGDWQEGITADTILARIIRQQNLGHIILMHDAGGNRAQTVKALPYIIDYFRDHGYQFVTISGLMGSKRESVMPPVKGMVKYYETFDKFLFFLTYLWEHFFHGFFIIAITLLIIRLLLMSVLSFINLRRERGTESGCLLHPKVSVIIPAYNEELTAEKTIRNIIQSDYQPIEVIFVDDGSKDNTYIKMNSVFGSEAKVRILTKTNGGKASALNYGIENCTGEILVCIDADTILRNDAISALVKYFADPATVAVAGNVRVGNPVTTLTSWQSIEYTTSQNFDRRAFDTLNSITVVPGAVGAFRKSAVEEIGLFATDTLAEDCDLTFRLLREGYIVRNAIRQ